MPFRPEAELKRPDLKGEFTCGVCFKRFCHAASLNRHRLNFHSGNHHCKLCDMDIPPNETLKSHMNVRHNIERVFTCGCCNWAFPDKKELHQHTSSMLKTGDPGCAQPIATNLHVAPGTMVAEKSPGVFQRTPSEARKSPPLTSIPQRPTTPLSHTTMPSIPRSAPSLFQQMHMQIQKSPPIFQPMDFQQHLLQALALQLQTNAAGAPAWLRAFMMNNAMPTTIFKNICTNNNVDGSSEDEHLVEPPAPIPVPSFMGQVPHVQINSIVDHGLNGIKTEVPEVKTELTQIKLEMPEVKEERNESHVDSASPTLSIDVLSTSSGGLMSGPSSDITCSTPPLDCSSALHSPGSSIGKKRKRTINDVVSFLHKKQAV